MTWWQTALVITGLVAWFLGIARMHRAYLMMVTATHYYEKGRELRDEAIARNNDAIEERSKATEFHAEAVLILERAQAIHQEMS